MTTALPILVSLLAVAVILSILIHHIGSDIGNQEGFFLGEDEE